MRHWRHLKWPGAFPELGKARQALSHGSERALPGRRGRGHGRRRERREPFWPRAVCPAAVFALALGAAAAPAGAASAAALHVVELRLPWPVRNEPIAIRPSPRVPPEVVVVGYGEGGSPELAVFSPDVAGRLPVRPSRLLELPADLVGFDVGPAPGPAAPGDALYLLTPSALLRWDAGGERLERVLEIASVYRVRPSGGPVRIDFLRDADGDGKEDLVLPGFDAYRVALFSGGSFGPVRSLPVVARMRIDGGAFVYSPVPLELADVDLDGRPDAFFVEDDSLVVLPAVAAERPPPARRLPLGFALRDARTSGTVIEAGGTGDAGPDRTVLAIADLDGDGLVDVLARTSAGSGLFGRRYALELWRGRRRSRGVGFPAAPDCRIETGLPVAPPTIADLDGDGRLDLSFGSIDLGLGSLVSALLTGSISIHVSFHRMAENRCYAEEPSASERLRVEFDLSTGRSSVPVLRLADLDGDGRADLVVGEGEDRLSIRSGAGSDDLFAATAATVEVPLPADGQLVTASDLDGDGRDDLVVRYGDDDGEERERTLRLLLSARLGSPAAAPAAPAR